MKISRKKRALKPYLTGFRDFDTQGQGYKNSVQNPCKF